MWRKIFNITIRVRTGEISASTAADKILSLMVEKEIGGSGALHSNGDLHGVRECNVSGEAESTGAPVNGSLEKITEAKEVCAYYGDSHNCADPVYKGCDGCYWFKIKLIDS